MPSKSKPVKNPKHSKSLQQWLDAENRLVAAEKKISGTFLDNMFGAAAGPKAKTSRPCVNVTPPKEPSKK